MLPSMQRPRQPDRSKCQVQANETSTKAGSSPCACVSCIGSQIGVFGKLHVFTMYMNAGKRGFVQEGERRALFLALVTRTLPDLHSTVRTSAKRLHCPHTPQTSTGTHASNATPDTRPDSNDATHSQAARSPDHKQQHASSCAPSLTQEPGRGSRRAEDNCAVAP